MKLKKSFLIVRDIASLSRDTEKVRMYTQRGQTDAGRYLIVFFIHKGDNTALILSARDMDAAERKRHERK